MKILFENDSIFIAEKKAKQFTHPMPGVPDSKDCLLYALRDHFGQYLYPINRLDRPVSGPVLFAKKAEYVQKFQEVWHEETTLKKYHCLHRGILQDRGEFNSSLSRRGAFKMVNKEIQQSALTLYNPLENFENEFCTYTEVEIKTGRYHQIRRHFRKAIMPIIGDRKHGKGAINQHFEKEYKLDRIFLHCSEFKIFDPIEKKDLHVKSELPETLAATLEALRMSRTL